MRPGATARLATPRHKNLALEKKPNGEVQPRRQEKPAIGFANPIALEQLRFLLHGNSLMLWTHALVVWDIGRWM